MIDTRIQWNGTRVRIKALDFSKAQNHLLILRTGVDSVKARLAKGIGSDDQKTKPLTKRYAIRKAKQTRRQAMRDLRLTGQMLEGIKPRFADDNRAIAEASGRQGRIKAAINRDLLKFSPKDQERMKGTAEVLFRNAAEQVFRELSPRRSTRSALNSFRNR